MIEAEIHNIFLHSSTYLVGNYLIDCGEPKEILDVLSRYRINLKGIFLTHCHIDHTYGLPRILNEYPDITIYCSSATYRGLKDDELNLQYITPEYAFEFSYDDNVRILEDGSYNIDGEIIVEAIPTKGHSSDCQTYIIGNKIYTGDAFIPGEKVFTKWPDSDKNDALNSIHLIQTLIRNRHLIVKPGHWTVNKDLL